MTLRTFSYGGGVQSTAALVLAARGEIDYPVFLMANVGDDSENPATLAYVRDHARPFAEAHGIALHELRWVKRDGNSESLYTNLTTPGGRAINIPVRMGNGAPGNRNCTQRYKIEPISRWLKARGATADTPAVLGMGISLDEYQRMRSDSGHEHYRLDYPLIDLRLTRADCSRIITDAGLPLPPKSSCWFCPFKRLADWRAQQREQPALFAASCDLEDTLNARRTMLGKDRVYLSSRLIPLRELLSAEQMTLDFETEDACESGFCMV